MSSRQQTADYLTEQIASAGNVRSRKMFGEYAIYCNEKVVALVCDDQLFVKPTAAGQAFVGECEHKPPYPKAKQHLFIPGEKWDDADWLSELIRLTADELPKKR